MPVRLGGQSVVAQFEHAIAVKQRSRRQVRSQTEFGNRGLSGIPPLATISNQLFGNPARRELCLSVMMRPVFGIETEYGITIQGVDSVDVVTESIELVVLHRTRRPYEMGLFS